MDLVRNVVSGNKSEPVQGIVGLLSLFMAFLSFDLGICKEGIDMARFILRIELVDDDEYIKWRLNTVAVHVIDVGISPLIVQIVYYDINRN